MSHAQPQDLQDANASSTLAERAGISAFRSDENRAVLRQFFTRLNAVSQTCRPDSPDHDPVIAAEVAKLLAMPDAHRQWSDAYQAELLLAAIRPRMGLFNEIRWALDIYRRSLAGPTTPYDAEAEALFAEDVSDNAVADRARLLLMRVLNDNQWRSTRRNIKRAIRKDYAKRLFSYLLGIVAFYVAVLFFTHLTSTGAGNFGFSYSGIFVAVSTGLVGGIFSMMTGQRTIHTSLSIEALLVATSSKMILLRLGIGLIAALIVYFFFESGLIGGELFPDLKQIGFARTCRPPGTLDFNGSMVPLSAECSATRTLGALVPNAELCKLVVWSFLAGFSEKLVPGMLARVEKGAHESDRED